MRPRPAALHGEPALRDAARPRRAKEERPGEVPAPGEALGSPWRRLARCEAGPTRCSAALSGLKNCTILSALAGHVRRRCGTKPSSSLFKDHCLQPQCRSAVPSRKPPFPSSRPCSGSGSRGRPRRVTGRQGKEHPSLLPALGLRRLTCAALASPGERASCPRSQCSAKTEGDNFCEKYLALSPELCSHSKNMLQHPLPEHREFLEHELGTVSNAARPEQLAPDSTRSVEYKEAVSPWKEIFYQYLQSWP